MDELLADFVAETREMLEQSGSELVAWEADPSKNVWRTWRIADFFTLSRATVGR